MNFKEKLAATGLPREEKIVLNYEDGAGVIHAYEDYVDAVVEKTGISSTISCLITDPSFKNEAIEDLRMNCYLEDYPRDGSGFDDFVAMVISDNIYDMDFIDRHTERYDYKRGHLTLKANIETTVGAVLDAPDYIFAGWSAIVSTPMGSLTLE